MDILNSPLNNPKDMENKKQKVENFHSDNDLFIGTTS